MTKIDTTEIDKKITELLPTARLDVGVQYARWAAFDKIMDEAEISAVKKIISPEGFYAGTVVGKPLTAFFFCDSFLE